MHEYTFYVKQKKEDSYIFYWVRWQQIINPWIHFLCVQKKEDSGVNRQDRYLRIVHWHFRKKVETVPITLHRKYDLTSPEIHLKKFFIRTGYGMMHSRFGLSSKCSSPIAVSDSDMVKKHTSADCRKPQEQVCLYRLKEKRVYHVKGYSGRITVKPER